MAQREYNFFIPKTHTIVPANVEFEISVFFAVTDGGTMEMLMVPCTKALL